MLIIKCRLTKRRSLNIEPYRINLNDIKFISSDFHKKLNKSKLEPGDVVIVRTGKPGTCTVVPEWLKEANCSDLVIVRPGHEIDAHYLAYYVNSIAAHHVYSHLVGAVQQHFNVGSAKKMKILLPTLNEQRSITAILNPISNKIELNNAINKNLEEMAQALFKRWFVDFEFPNDNGEPYRSSGGELMESELGLIPKGWEVNRIGDVVDFKSGYSFKSSSYDIEGKYRIITIKNVDDGKFIPFTDNRINQLPENLKSHHILSNGDILLSLTGNVGRTALVYGHHEYLLNQRVAKLEPKHGISIGWLYALFRNEEIKQKLIQISRGTAQANLSPVETANLKVILPPIELLVSLSKHFSCMMNGIILNSNNSIILEEIRDTLLPKLMSGEIRVPLEQGYELTTDLPMAAERKEQYSTT